LQVVQNFQEHCLLFVALRLQLHQQTSQQKSLQMN
jgi:hypothetical protein